MGHEEQQWLQSFLAWCQWIAKQARTCRTGSGRCRYSMYAEEARDRGIGFHCGRGSRAIRQAKTQKRLVTKAKYVTRLLLEAFVCAVLFYPLYIYPLSLHDRIGMFILGVLFSGVYLWSGKVIEPVAPITRHNTERLPVEESLVRSSTEPPTDQQAQLLRAAQGGQETPQEQLLRSAQE